MEGNDKKGGVIVGPTDINGRKGIIAEQPDGSPIKIGGGEIIMNEKTSTAHCEHLSELNVEGGGVAFPCDVQPTANSDRASGKMYPNEYHQESAAGGKHIEDFIQKRGLSGKGAPVKFRGDAKLYTTYYIAGNRTSIFVLDSNRYPHKKLILDIIEVSGKPVAMESGGGQAAKNAKARVNELERKLQNMKKPYPYTVEEWAGMLKEFYSNNDIDYSKHGVESIEQDLKASPYGDRLNNKDSYDLALEIEQYFERERHASSGTKTPERIPTHMNHYYLKIGNLINEWHNGAVSYRYEIMSFKKNVDGNMVAMVKEHSLTKNRPTPQFEILLSHIQDYMEMKHYQIDGTTYENDRDKILLANEVDAIRSTEINKEITAKLEAAKLDTAAERIAKHSHKKASRRTIEGMEALNGDSYAGGKKIDRFLDAVRISDNDIQLKDLEVSATPKGNWHVYHNGKSLMTVNGDLLDEETIRKHNLEYHGMAGGGKISKTGMQLILDETSGAYSRDTYGEEAWKASIENLHKKGYTEEEIAWILNSKYMRWAADTFYEANKPYRGNEIIKYREAYGIELDELHGKPKKLERIINQYDGKLAGDVWDAWDKAQRTHFVHDHFEKIQKEGGNFTTSISAATNLTHKKYIDLSAAVQRVVVRHVEGGQYASGTKFGIYDNPADQGIAASRKDAARNKGSKLQKKLMKKYAKECGFESTPATWAPTDYTAAGWKKLIKNAKKSASAGAFVAGAVAGAAVNHVVDKAIKHGKKLKYKHKIKTAAGGGKISEWLVEDEDGKRHTTLAFKKPEKGAVHVDHESHKNFVVSKTIGKNK